MTLIIGEDGKVVNITEKSIDTLKRENYKHSPQARLIEEADLESFVDNLEEVEDEAGEEEGTREEKEVGAESLELGMLYAEFKTFFMKMYPDEDIAGAFEQLDTFFRDKGIDVAVATEQEEEIPGEAASEQSIVTSEVENE